MCRPSEQPEERGLSSQNSDSRNSIGLTDAFKTILAVSQDVKRKSIRNSV